MARDPYIDRLSQPTAQWLEVINQHVAAHRTREKRTYDRALAYVNGNAWVDTQGGESEGDVKRTSTNLLHPIVDTGMTTLVPRNPNLVLNPRGQVDPEAARAGQALINYFLEACSFRTPLKRAVYHTLLYGLGVLKTTWDADNDRAGVKAVDPRNYFCDMTAQMAEDLKYEIEATLISRKEMEERVAAGMYAEHCLGYAADRYPQWMLPDKRPDAGVDGSGFSRETNNLLNYQSWFLIYEVYDRESGVVYHYSPQSEKPLLVDEMLYRPYDLLSFHYNGENCRGLSEIGLLLDNQREYNDTESYLRAILRASIPGLFYDQSMSSADKEQQRFLMPIGGMAGVKVPGNKSVADLFFPKPLPQVPALAHEMMAAKRQTIGEISAVAAAQRGQAMGAKTATELAFIKAAIQDRLSSRQDDIFNICTRVGAKMYFLAQRLMREERVVEVTGGRGGFATANPATLAQISATFSMSTYSAVETNPAVRAESLRMAYPLLATNPLVNQRRLTLELLKAQELPEDILMTEEEMAAQQQPPAAPGQPSGDAPPPPTDPTQAPDPAMPNRVAAMAEPVAPQPQGPGPGSMPT